MAVYFIRVGARMLDGIGSVDIPFGGVRQPTDFCPPLLSANDASAVPFGKRVAAARRSRGLTQRDLANAIGVTANAVALWETEGKGTSSARMMNIARSLGVTVGRLLGETDNSAEEAA